MSLSSNPPTLILSGYSCGGPPTTHVWMRDGAEIGDRGIFSIPNAVISHNVDDCQNSHHRSLLTVSGRLAGVYQYSVTNRATSGMSTGSLEGIMAMPTEDNNYSGKAI